MFYVGHNIPQLNQRYGYSDNYDHSGSSSDEDDWSSRVGRRKFRPGNWQLASLWDVFISLLLTIQT